MEEKKYHNLNYWQKAAVHHAHPASFIFNLLGLLWAGYFFWFHQWLWALLCLAFSATGGLLWAFLDRSYLIQAKSQLNDFQKLLVYHTNTANLLFHLMALVLYFLGTWQHSAPYLLGAVSFVLLGHLFPWLYHKKKDRLFTLMIDEDVSAKEEE